MIRYPNKYKDTEIPWVPQIPENWRVLRGKFIFKNKKVINEKMQCKERLALTLKGVIDRYEGDGIGLNPNDLRTYQIFEEDNLVFKLIDLENKKTSRVGYVHKKGIMSSAYIRLIKNSDINTRYYFYQYYDLYQRYIFNMIGQGVRATMAPSDLLNISVVIPPLETQNVIVTYLDKKTRQIQDFIQKKERLIELLEGEKAVIINRAVTNGINPNCKMKNSGIKWIGKYPEHWEILKLRFLGSCQNGISIGGEKFGYGSPFVSYSDVYKNLSLPKNVDGLVNSSKLDRINYSVKEGDVFFTRTSETIEEIGIAATCMQKIEDAVFAGFLIRFRPKKKTLFKGYSKYYFRAIIHRAYFVKEVNLVTRASLSQGLLKGLPVLLPPIEEQELISKYLEKELTKRDNLISKAKIEIEKIKEYQGSLITNVVTGKNKVPA